MKSTTSKKLLYNPQYKQLQKVNMYSSLLPMKGKENPNRRKVPKEETREKKHKEIDRSKRREDKRTFWA